MIPRKFRLTGKKEIEVVKNRGRLIQSVNFAFVWLGERGRDGGPRFGLIVSKKISTKAVVRNQIKRRLRFILMQLAPRVKRGYDLLFLTKKSILGIAVPLLEKEVELVLTKEDIII